MTGPHTPPTGHTRHPLSAQGMALVEAGRSEAALEVLGRRLAEDPEDLFAWVWLARAHFGRRDYQQAYDATAEALVRDPEYYDAYFTRSFCLRRVGRYADALDMMERAVRIDPDNWLARAGRAELLMLVDPKRPDDAWEEARAAARLGPEEQWVREVLLYVATETGREEAAEEARRTLLGSDPGNTFAVPYLARREADQPGTSAARAADTFAAALAVVPGSADLRSGLDAAVYRMLRGTRWLALGCLVIAAAAVNTFPTEGEEPVPLPLPLGMRLWVLVLMSAVWGFGAWRRYRTMRLGVRMSVRPLVAREPWARVVLVQAAWATLCGVLIAVVPWTGRDVPQLLFWTGLVPALATVLHDRKKIT
ncbi:tetratricopeptide repeat protein [Streptomyces sp. G-G2]|uniref:tetratricopeptide repeat protein n=1 Tax=Streptomyces sp. G-G2 TaxID=3046201 RepID=UPI0024BA7BFB|nr:tetratricopeptide repeat protein [Streptomyces sp. G-G2]MDJ0383112.1 tetratricopeptide repeat protein [Streptomyces sp. G-G2]